LEIKPDRSVGSGRLTAGYLTGPPPRRKVGWVKTVGRPSLRLSSWQREWATLGSTSKPQSWLSGRGWPVWGFTALCRSFGRGLRVVVDDKLPWRCISPRGWCIEVSVYPNSPVARHRLTNRRAPSNIPRQRLLGRRLLAGDAETLSSQCAPLRAAARLSRDKTGRAVRL
jgi:hypothetical protein